MVTTKTDGERTIFVFKTGDNTLANSIRRIIIDEVPTFAIEDVEVISNGSPLYDETIAHRLGLIPLVTDLESYEIKDSCKCGGIGCAMCEVKMTLSQDEDGYVYSGSIKSDDPKVVPVDMEIPITKLFKGKKIELSLKAVLGKGKEHVKWSPAHAYLNESDKELELVVEPFGQLPVKDIYNKAIDVLIEKIEELEAQL